MVHSEKMKITEEGSADLYMNLVIGLAHKWLGRPAVEDAADVIAEMRAQGILVYGLFLGRTENLGNLSLMYGHHQVRIHDISQLARAAGEIFTKAVEEL